METPKMSSVAAVALGGGLLWLVFRGRKQSDGSYTVDPAQAPPTLTRQAARILADQVYFAVYGDGSAWSGSVTEDEEAIIAAMIVPRNANDVALIIEEYGVRVGPWWTIPGALNLVATIRQYMEPVEIGRINNYYAAHGINIRL